MATLHGLALDVAQERLEVEYQNRVSFKRKTYKMFETSTSALRLLDEVQKKM